MVEWCYFEILFGDRLQVFCDAIFMYSSLVWKGLLKPLEITNVSLLAFSKYLSKLVSVAELESPTLKSVFLLGWQCPSNHDCSKCVN